MPDFLVGAAQFGPIFTNACNMHDRCYGTVGKTKAECDIALKEDMILQAEMEIPAALHLIYMPLARAQAAAYSQGLQWETIAPWTSLPAFNTARDEAYCRSWASDYAEEC